MHNIICHFYVGAPALVDLSRGLSCSKLFFFGIAFITRPGLTARTDRWYDAVGRQKKRRSLPDLGPWRSILLKVQLRAVLHQHLGSQCTVNWSSAELCYQGRSVRGCTKGAGIAQDRNYCLFISPPPQSIKGPDRIPAMSICLMPRKQVGVGRVVTLGSLGVVMVNTLAQDAWNAGSIPALRAIFLILIGPTTVYEELFSKTWPIQNSSLQCQWQLRKSCFGKGCLINLYIDTHTYTYVKNSFPKYNLWTRH